MVLTSTWHLILALGCCLAFMLLPWIARYPQQLQIRNGLFILSQSVIFLFLLAPPLPLATYLPLLCLLALLVLSEQICWLSSAENPHLKSVRHYQIIIACMAVVTLLVPTTISFLLTACVSLLSTMIVFVVYPQDVFERSYIRNLLLCWLLVAISHHLVLAISFFAIASVLLQSVMIVLILSAIVAYLTMQQQYLQFSQDVNKPEHLPPPVTHNEEQTHTLSHLSHEMRTPLSGILGMTELLLDTQLSSTQRDYTHTIQASGNALLHLINDRLDAQNNQEKDLTILEEVFDMNELMSYCLDTFKSHADEKNIELISYLDSSLPKEVLGDAVRLRQILCRLLHNAIRFTDHGEVVISIKNTLYEHNLGIQFSVQDTGIGLNAAQIKVLFKNHPQLEPDNTWYIGPNLATCAQLITQMGGRLEVESSPYEGALFSFTLPLKTPNSVLNESTTEFIASFAGKRLLVVDDNRTVTKVLAEQATQWGMRVSTADNGAEALAIARNAANLGQSFDVIIIDYQMPGMSGLQLGARLKEDALITNDVILIMLTGLRQKNIQNLARNAGIHCVLSKPISNKQLRQVISRELKRLQNVISPTVSQTGQLGQLKVLIAEDNQLSQKVIRGMMQKLGIEHTLVNNGREALLAVMQGNFDLVLMDCDMPIMDGYTATQEIRRWERQTHRPPLPILALTAHILEEQKQKALNSGMNQHLSKPIELGDLQNALLKTVKLH